MERPISSASAPISIASTASPIKSPALVPTIPAEIIFFETGSNNNFVFPSIYLIAKARPLAAHGNSHFSYATPCFFNSASVGPAHAISGSVKITAGITAGSNAAL